MIETHETYIYDCHFQPIQNAGSLYNFENPLFSIVVSFQKSHLRISVGKYIKLS